MKLGEPVEVTRQIAQVLERLGIAYLVGGSLASSLHGIPRATQDVDIVADIAFEQVDVLVDALKSKFYIDGDMLREAIRNRSSFNIIHLSTMFKADIFILKPDPVSQQEMMRREKYQITDDPQEQVYLATAEDMIIHKLYWYQLGDHSSERQWQDVLGIIQVQNNLDYAYLKEIAQKRRVSHLLEKILKAANQ